MSPDHNSATTPSLLLDVFDLAIVTLFLAMCDWKLPKLTRVPRHHGPSCCFYPLVKETRIGLPTGLQWFQASSEPTRC
eukprot:3490034-Rhodomonas_salina.1